MTQSINLNEEGTTLDLRPGSVLVIYTDDGPSGACGQSMNVTCPHTVLHLFPTEEDFCQAREHLRGRGGKNAKMRIVKIGDWATGQFSVVKHK